MKKYALLLGSAPEDFRQKKIEDMFDFLDSKRSAGDSIVTFANGISELMLEMVMDNSVKQLAEDCHSELQDCHSELVSESIDDVVSTGSTTASDKNNSILLYICTLRPAGDGEKTIWLGGEEIRKDVILHYQELAKDCGIDMQVVMDWDSEMMSEEEAGWEKIEDCRVKPDNDTKVKVLRPSAESAGDRN